MNETRELSVAGVSFRTAPVAVRQSLSFSAAQAADLLGGASAQFAGLEAVVLSTCNRTEFYVAAPLGAPVIEALLLSVRRERPGAPIRHLECERYEYSGVDAMRHLLRVACGLDSSILGDVQILSQIKRAVDVASTSGTLGKTLSQAFTQAIHCGRNARSETRISRGCASVGSAIVETISRHLQQPDSPELPRLLLIGAGQTATDIAWHLSKRRLGSWTVVNRTRENAVRLAAHGGVEAADWEDLDRLVTSSDVIIAATSANEPVVSRAHLETIAAARPQRFPLLIDAGVPHNIEAQGKFPVVDIDAIREQRDTVLDARRAAIPEVERFIDAELMRWRRWLAGRPIESSLADLYRTVESHSREVAEKLFSNGGQVSLDQAERVVRASLRQLLTPHARRLRNLETWMSAEKEPACAGD